MRNLATRMLATGAALALGCAAFATTASAGAVAARVGVTPTITIALAANPIAYGETTNATVTVSGSAGVPHGTVQVGISGEIVTAPPLDSSGRTVVTLPKKDASRGGRDVNAWFAPSDATYTAADTTASPVKLVILPREATVTINAPASASFGEKVTASATISMPGGFSPEGVADFHYMGSVISVTVGADGLASATLPSGGIGARPLKVDYSPNGFPNLAKVSGTTSILVVKDTTTSKTRLRYSAKSKSLVGKTSIVATHGNPIRGGVKFVVKRNGVKQLVRKAKVNAKGVATLTVKGAKPGKYVVVAKYLGTLQFQPCKSKATGKV